MPVLWLLMHSSVVGTRGAHAYGTGSVGSGTRELAVVLPGPELLGHDGPVLGGVPPQHEADGLLDLLLHARRARAGAAAAEDLGGGDWGSEKWALNSLRDSQFAQLMKLLAESVKSKHGDDVNLEQSSRYDCQLRVIFKTLLVCKT